LRSATGIRWSWPLFILFKFLEQLLFQMAARCLFNRASLCCYRFLFCLAFSPCLWFGGLRQVPDLRPMRAHFSLFWFCVGIHEKSYRFLFAIKKTGTAASWRLTENITTDMIDLS
jgi:hypothetical protein